jgi:hypothetical protein
VDDRVGGGDVFKIVTDNSRATLEPLYGALRGILASDRLPQLLDLRPGEMVTSERS